MSLGEEPIEQVTVPNLANRTEQDAINLINETGLTLRTTIRESDSRRPNGVVVDQSINTGTVVDRGTEITITVNEFDELVSGTVTVNVRDLLAGQEDVPERVELQVQVNGVPIGTRMVPRNSRSEEFNFQDRGNVEITVWIEGNRLGLQTLNLNQRTTITIR